MLILHPIPLQRKLQVPHPAHRNPITSRNKLQQFFLLLKIISLNYAPEIAHGAVRRIPADVACCAAQLGDVDFLDTFDNGLQGFSGEEREGAAVYAGEETLFEGVELWADGDVCQEADIVADIAVAVRIGDHRRVVGVSGGMCIGELGPVGGCCFIAHFDGDGLAELLNTEFVGARKYVFYEPVFFVPFEEGSEAIGKVRPAVCYVVEFGYFFVEEFLVECSGKGYWESEAIVDC